MSDVKPSRADRARATRERMLRTAADCFVQVGFAAATMDEVARAAGVAVQTLYYSFRTKGQLLIAVVDFVASGEIDARPVMSREWVREAMASTDPDRVVDLLAQNGTAIYRGVAPLLPAIRAASGDADVNAFWEATATARKAGMRRMMTHLDSLGALSCNLDDATDLLFALSSHETYRSLVVESGWPESKYVDWVAATLKQQLLRANET